MDTIQNIWTEIQPWLPKISGLGDGHALAALLLVVFWWRGNMRAFRWTIGCMFVVMLGGAILFRLEVLRDVIDSGAIGPAQVPQDLYWYFVLIVVATTFRLIAGTRNATKFVASKINRRI